MTNYRITYSKPSATGIKGRSTGSMFISAAPSYWTNGVPALQHDGYTITVTNLDTLESVTHHPIAK